MVHREEDMLWNSLYTTSLGEQDVWYWRRIKPASLPGLITFPLTLTAKASGDYSATLRISQMSSCGAAVRQVRLLFNNLQVAEKSWGDAGVRECFVTVISGTLSQDAILQNGADVITWAVDSSVGYGEWLNWLEVEYQRQFLALDDELAFGGDLAGSWTYTLSGWTTDTVQIWDVTQPFTPTRILSPVVSGSGPYSVTFGYEHAAETKLIAVGSGAVRAPSRLTRYVPVDLDPDGGADWVAVTHSDFITAVLRLADYRASQGMRVVVADVEDLYNQYAYGIYQPVAIRDYLAHAQEWPGLAPGYALLVGDGHWNFKGVESCSYCSLEPIFIPPFMAVVDPYQGEVPADNKYATLLGDDLMPDIALGRLPVRTLTETELLVDKIIGHESDLVDQERWQLDVVFVAGAPKPGTDEDFYTPSDVNANQLSGPYQPVRIYHGQSPYTDTEETAMAVVDSFNRGAVMVTYHGHGGVMDWDDFFFATMTPLLTNTDRLPVVVSMDCLDTYFALPKLIHQALSEEMFRSSDGGSVGHWGSAGLGLPSDHNVLSWGFFNGLFPNGLINFGDAALAGKLELFSRPFQAENHNLHTFTLLADPAMTVIPTWLYLPLVMVGRE
jgi:hypothetical protein